MFSEKIAARAMEITNFELSGELDVVLANKMAMQLAEIAGLSIGGQTRFATAVSEICRNCIQHVGKGKITFGLAEKEGMAFIEALIKDKGRGIGNLELILDGRFFFPHGKGKGLLHSKKLSDDFEIQSDELKGTRVRLAKRLPRHEQVTKEKLERIKELLASDKTVSPYEEIKKRNMQLLQLSEELQQKNDEVTTLHRQLQNSYSELEARVNARTSELSSSNTELNRSNADLEKFAYIASHDLSEPLRKITVFSHRLQDDENSHLSPEGKEYISRLQNSTQRMQTLITDLLTYSRVSRGGKGFSELDMNEVLQQTLNDLSVSIENAGAEIKAEKLPSIKAQPLHMSQLFQNLISNSLKFRQADLPLRIEVKGSIVKGSAAFAGSRYLKQNAEYLQLEISDNGIGFEETHLDKIFDIFQRLHGHSEYAGTGIGLAICQKIADNHGGYITARSTPGQGSTFYIWLPVK